MLVCATVGFFVRRRRQKMLKGSDSESEEENCTDLDRGVAAGPRRYTYHGLAAATSNFADDEKLGQGGFGSVYRGHLLLTKTAVRWR